MEALREYTGVVDIPSEIKRIQKESREKAQQELEFGGATMPNKKDKKVTIPAAAGALPPEQSRKKDSDDTEPHLNGNRTY